MAVNCWDLLNTSDNLHRGRVHLLQVCSNIVFANNFQLTWQL